MAIKSKALGKGLDALIPTSEIGEDEVIRQEVEKGTTSEKIVKLTSIEPNRDQPRKTFDESDLSELAESIKELGMIEPILVVSRGTHYEIVAGERRWRAARMAGLKEVPVRIGEFTPKQIDEIAIVENIQRKDLNDIEEARAYKRLMTEHNMKQEEVAKRVSKSRPYITNSMRLLKLDETVQQMVIDGSISGGHARALLAFESNEDQVRMAKKILSDKLTVRDVEKLSKNNGITTKTVKTPISSEMQLFYDDMAEKMKQKLGTKVSISAKPDGKGKIEIEFYSNDDLDRLISKIKN